MPKYPLRDLVIFLPGITGSVIKRQEKGIEKDIWNVSKDAFWNVISSWKDLMANLQVTNPTLTDPNKIDDRIRATSIMADFHIIPGLVKINGYSRLLKYIYDKFDVRVGKIEEPDPLANFFPFPYDWRYSNELAANQLNRFIAHQLPIWKINSHQPNAKVIFIAHSMGGLVARFYLECLNGWSNCKALFTLGTPYLGSVNALGYLANGYKQAFIDLTNVVRTFPSVYELLPTYPVIYGTGRWQQVNEFIGLPNINSSLLRQAQVFHRKIVDSVEQHQQDPNYQRHRYRIIHVAGTHQPTFQSAYLNKDLSLDMKIPECVDPLLNDGDGTVPLFSAIPPEFLGKEYNGTFFSEQHSSLQANSILLDGLVEQIRQTQIRAISPICGESSIKSVQPIIRLHVDDLYVRSHESIELWVQLLNKASTTYNIQATIYPMNSPAMAESILFQQKGDEWKLTIPDIAPGVYHVTIDSPQGGIPAVHSSFVVID
jgi:pimeloyl-ACP methyl ester carboxylesterase